MALQTVMLLQIGENYEFYSTPTALYSLHTAEELGISRASLNNYFSRLGDMNPKIYENNKCRIVKGSLCTASRGVEL